MTLIERLRNVDKIDDFARIEAADALERKPTDDPPDLVEVLGCFTNFVNNERVRSYNNGLDTGIAQERERCALIAENATIGMSPGPLYSAGFAGAINYVVKRIRGHG